MEIKEELINKYKELKIEYSAYYSFNNTLDKLGMYLSLTKDNLSEKKVDLLKEKLENLNEDIKKYIYKYYKNEK